MARVFRTLGVPVFEADAEGRRVLNEDQVVFQAVADRFGIGILRNGQVDRAALANIVFQDPAALKDLNAIVHPVVRSGFRHWADAQKSSYVLMEAAVLAEHGGHRAMDRVIVVTAPAELRIQRVMDRDKVSGTAVKARMANQVSEEERLAIAHHVIQNDDRALVIPQVLAIHRALCNFAEP